MRIIRHKTRRRYHRRVNDDGYYTVEGVISTDDIEEATDVAMEIWRHEIKHAPKAQTLWEKYDGC